jgi:hypothetical protein
MRWANVNPRSSLCVDPSANASSAGEYERMWAVLVNYPKLKVQVVRRAIDDLPSPKCALHGLPGVQQLSIFHQTCN